MNKLKKIGLTALAGSLVAGAVNAAEMSVSGSAGMTFSGGDNNANTGNGWSMGDSLTFSASGDVNDIGVTLSYELDGDAPESVAGTGALMDDHSIAFDLGDLGSLTFAGHGGSSALSARDDVMPAAYEEPWAVVTGAAAAVVNGDAEENMFSYSYAHDSGVSVALAYHNAEAGQSVESYMDYAVEYNGVEGLRIGYAEGTVHDTAAEADENTVFATYAIGGFTIGFQASESDEENGTANDRETTGFGISYQVSDDLSVSYGNHETDYSAAANEDQDASAVGIAYTMGSMSVSASYHNVDNIAGTGTNDRNGYEISMSFAF